MKNKTYTPFVWKFVDLLKKGYLQLEPEIKNEVRRFISECQHPDGGFTDRKGTSDLYYSLFGILMATALDMHEVIEKHKIYIKGLKEENMRGIDHYLKILIRGFLFRDLSKPPVFLLLRMFFQKGRQINPVYRIFLWLLSFDLFYGKPLIVRLIARLALTFNQMPADSPCSIAAAYITAMAYAGLPVIKESKALFLYFDEEQGFKTFRDTPHADLLSTAVALFALRASETRIESFIPACLRLAGENYTNGAFLSGDGDTTRDTEYTFYGLLTIGASAST